MDMGLSTPPRTRGGRGVRAWYRKATSGTRGNTASSITRRTQRWNPRAGRNSVGSGSGACHDHRVDSDWPKAHIAGWRAVVAELRDQGWDVRLLGYEAPVQLEGTRPSGEPFYFRARWEEVSLAVGGDDPADVPEWRGHEPYGEKGSMAASSLPSDDGVRLLHRLVHRYRGE
jgi:hypothetical protein